MRKSHILLMIVAAVVVALFAASCTPPKVLTSYGFRSETKTGKTFMQRSGASADTGGKQATNLFNVFVRICDLDASNNETNCKDTLVLENVNPRTVY